VIPEVGGSNPLSHPYVTRRTSAILCCMNLQLMLHEMVSWSGRVFFLATCMNSELIDRLVLELDITREQAEGGAGLVLQWAQARLTTNEFQTVADSIPAISDVIGKSPIQAAPSPRGWLSWFKQQISGLGNLTPLADPLHQLGLSTAMVRPLAAVILQHFHEQSGSEVELLLKRAIQ
jgi:hypothetical protein